MNADLRYSPRYPHLFRNAVLTVVTIAGWRLITYSLNAIAAPQLATIAGAQFRNSDVAPAQLAAALWAGWWTPFALLLCVLVVLYGIWRPTLRALFADLRTAAGALLILMLMPLAGAHAFWNKTDTTEAYGVLPNHSAFWVPGTGDTKGNQVQMESEDFLKSNKVAAKFFSIPHVKLSGSSYYGWDYYIPAGRLIVVDRAPFFHEWTRAGRGTDAGSDQSFPCHSHDNVPVSAEVSMAASVTEENAAKFLFFFGVNQPKGDAGNPEVIFTSMYEGKSLGQVMGGWGRGEIQSRVCREINKYTVEELGNRGNNVLDAIQEGAAKFFKNFGIDVEYVGWAGGFGYPPEVQDAINQRFAAEHVRPVLDVLQQRAAITALAGWDHHLPTTVTLSSWGSLGDVVTTLLGSALGPRVAAPVAPAK